MTDIEAQLQKNVNGLFAESSKGRYLSDQMRISELCYCPAKAYYYRTTGKRPDLNGAMLSGSLLHDKLPLLVKGIPELKEAEFEKECFRDHKDFSIMGHCDAATKDTIYELKFSKSNVDLYGLSEAWQLQVNCYATLLNKKEWCVLAVHSYSLKVKAFWGKQSDKGYETILDNAKKIFEGLNNKEAPLGPKYNWECKWCSLQEECEYYPKKEEKKEGK